MIAGWRHLPCFLEEKRLNCIHRNKIYEKTISIPEYQKADAELMHSAAALHKTVFLHKNLPTICQRAYFCMHCELELKTAHPIVRILKSLVTGHCMINIFDLLFC